ncbi:hypothetical protein SY83_05990 [Paenibacillus swuensis]|uniref:Xylose isomerase-like TIM barrel domain-containing protein n=1 Tax=Paenibacillus swuensis TaxID=1178515 RepID=A0A172TFS2_9BACL|nr:sugar phosphate isomerase/epimerase family protein [Paenibacillus swuensis]ANE45915.1 hypothetical protein SY83_05990 [Paenibacillus swuensis]
MLLTCKENMIQGLNMSEVCRKVKDAGFDGIDLMGGVLKQQLIEVKSALRDTGLVSAAVYGQLGKAGSSLIDLTAAARVQALDLFKERIELAAEVGAGRLIFVPRFGKSELRPEASDWVLITMLDELAEWAAGIPVTLIMEPLNRRESEFLHDPLKGLALVSEVGRPNVKTMIDTYHMFVEQQDVTDVTAQLGSALGLVHLSDSERKLPGQGVVDFQQVLHVLHKVRYDGPLGFECKEAGLTELHTSVAYIKELLADVQAAARSKEKVQ